MCNKPSLNLLFDTSDKISFSFTKRNWYNVGRPCACVFVLSIHSCLKTYKTIEPQTTTSNGHDIGCFMLVCLVKTRTLIEVKTMRPNLIPHIHK